MLQLQAMHSGSPPVPGVLLPEPPVPGVQYFAAGSVLHAAGVKFLDATTGLQEKVSTFLTHVCFVGAPPSTAAPPLQALMVAVRGQYGELLSHHRILLLSCL